jgi:hypothetical protein
LLGQPGHCQTIRPDMKNGWSGLARCALRGQQLAEQWLMEHPKWQLDRIRCTPGNRREPTTSRPDSIDPGGASA